ncbi:hypothetical protein FMEAI12_6670002 [Parafrankia sp. Ea1.12]|nr:hypothetical protein FMEAI12_6670002 [Parafrankia sp. Ea1.12]
MGGSVPSGVAWRVLTNHLRSARAAGGSLGRDVAEPETVHPGFPTESVDFAQ